MITVGDARALPFADGIAQTCVTSPPYFGLRDYGQAGQIGMERTVNEYVQNMVAVMREVRRVLRDDGTLWLNLGDTYSANRGYQVVQTKDAETKRDDHSFNNMGMSSNAIGVAPKNLIGIPWRVAFALQADGWYLRSDIIWSKPNPMPESVTDRPTKAHEYVFLMTKHPRYYYDAEAIRESVKESNTGEMRVRARTASGPLGGKNQHNVERRNYAEIKGANARSVWQISTQPYSGAHFATMPPELARRCILAGSAPGSIVLDPFMGSGTTPKVAIELGRLPIGVDLNASYVRDHVSERTTTTIGIGI